MRPSRQISGRLFLSLAWLLLLTSVPLLSLYGRDLQQLVAQYYSSRQLGWLIGAMLLLLTLAALAYLRHYNPTRGWRHALWIVPLFIIAPWFLSIVEERVHFILFGLFGFFTLLLFPARRAYALCLLLGVADESLQWALPDRVGDWRDVGLNLLAAWGGASLALVSRRA
jgi:hypothetical protein